MRTDRNWSFDEEEEIWIVSVWDMRTDRNPNASALFEKLDCISMGYAH